MYTYFIYHGTCIALGRYLGLFNLFIGRVPTFIANVIDKFAKIFNSLRKLKTMNVLHYAN